MATLYTGSPRSTKAQLKRALTELTYRRTRVWEHPDFGGVRASAHIRGSKHLTGNAGDLNRGYGQADEDAYFDRFAVEFMARGFGVIWNRRNYAGDHTHHLHLETITAKSENYAGRVKLKAAGTDRTFDLKVDGIGGNRTIRALQTAMGTVVDGEMDWGGSVAKALQAFLNTENYPSKAIAVDGKPGRATSVALSAWADFKPSSHDYITQAHWREIQARLNKHGHLGRPA